MSKICMITKIRFSERLIIKYYKKYINEIIKIQKTFKVYLFKNKVKLSLSSKDGRINSCIDEDKIIDVLKIKFKNRMFIPKIRMWYDILLFDNLCGWIPVNIKIT